MLEQGRWAKWIFKRFLRCEYCGTGCHSLLQRASYLLNAVARRFRLLFRYREPEKRGERLPSGLSPGPLPCAPNVWRILLREAIRFQIRDRIAGPIVDQQILAILLINAPG